MQSFQPETDISAYYFKNSYYPEIRDKNTLLKYEELNYEIPYDTLFQHDVHAFFYKSEMSS